MTTTPHDALREAFHAWLDHALPAAVPPRVVAFVLKLSEGTSTFDVQLVGTARFDSAGTEWTGDEVFTSGDDRFSIKRSVVENSWNEALSRFEAVLTDYLATGRRAGIMTSSEGVALGFIDGDLLLIHPAQPLQVVHAVFDYYDGVESGVADFDGRPHAFRREHDATDDWSDWYRLKALADEEFRLVMVDCEIWTRWLAAFRAGTAEPETHPALPEDRPMHDEIATAVTRAVSVDDETSKVVWGTFHGRLPPDGELRVLWRVLLG